MSRLRIRGIIGKEKWGDFLIIEYGVSTWRNKNEQSGNAQQKLSPGP